MFDHLVESRPHRSRGTVQMLVSIAIHTAIIALSIQLTRAVAETVTQRPTAIDIRLTRAPVHDAPRATSPVAAPTALASPMPALPAVPLIVPTAIPPVELGTRFDPNRFNQIGAPHGGPPDASRDSATDPLAAIRMEQADEPVIYLEGPRPLYPPALRQVGIEGSVTLRYIVGVDGTAEPGSIEVVRSTNRSFEPPAIDAIRLARFRAARIRGHAVRQVVEQVVRFTLGGT